MDVDRHDAGVPSWIDMGAPDVAKAAAFYSALLGWEVADSAPETGGYRICTLRGRSVAGLGPAQNPGPPFWSTYVTVDDADATVAKVGAAGGGVVVPPMDVMEFGRMAVCTDTTGAFFSLWQPALHIGCEVVNEPGALCWNELMSSDVEASVAFYAAVFGWEARTSAGDMPYTEWLLGERTVGGMMPRPAEMPAEAPDAWSVYFAVDDCDAAMAKIAELGGAVFMGPMTVDVGTFAVAADDQGAMFNVIALNPGAMDA